MSLTISVIVLLLIGVAVYCFWYFRNSSTILETRTFSCPGMNGFTFDYPVFKGLPVISIRHNAPTRCTMFLQGKQVVDAPELVPQINVQVASYAGTTPAPSFAQVNQYGVKYRTDNGLLNDTGAEFWIGHGLDSAVSIKLVNLPEDYGFSRDAFWKTVTESFRVIALSRTTNDKILGYTEYYFSETTKVETQPVVFQYTLRLYNNNTATLQIDGYQTYAFFDLKTRQHDNVLSFYFSGTYGPDNASNGYDFKKGDELFSLAKISEKLYEPTWEILKPISVENDVNPKYVDTSKGFEKTNSFP